MSLVKCVGGRVTGYKRGKPCNYLPLRKHITGYKRGKTYTEFTCGKILGNLPQARESKESVACLVFKNLLYALAQENGKN